MVTGLIANIHQTPTHSKENVVAIKVFSHYINGMTRGPAISTKEKWQERVWLREYLPPLNNFYPIILTAILAILLFITLKGELPGVIKASW